MDIKLSAPVHSNRDQSELPQRGEGGGPPGPVHLQETRPRLPRRLLQERGRGDRRHRHGEAVGVRCDRSQATADTQLDAGRHEGRGGLPLEADGRCPRRSTTVRDARLQARRSQVQAALQEEDDTARPSDRSGETGEKSPAEAVRTRQGETWLRRFRPIRITFLIPVVSLRMS